MKHFKKVMFMRKSSDEVVAPMLASTCCDAYDYCATTDIGTCSNIDYCTYDFSNCGYWDDCTFDASPGHCSLYDHCYDDWSTATCNGFDICFSYDYSCVRD